MKKKDVLKAIDKKNIKNNRKPSNNKSNTKKNNRKKSSKNTVKKDPIVLVDERIIPVEEEDKEDDVVSEVVIKPPRTLKQKCIRFAITLSVIFVGFIVLLLTFLTLTEYKPDDVMDISIVGEGFQDLTLDSTFDIMTWNIGYGALGDNADFFMDGGKMVTTADRSRIDKNMKGIISKIDEVHPNIFFVQEVDVYSKRSKHVNELASISNRFNAYSYSYARNYKAMFVPYPLGDMIGSVDSGIATFSKFKMESSKRISLPSSFIWPVSTANFKRCLLVSYVPIKDSDKKLVLINLHFDAYGNGKAKEKQTKAFAEILKEELANGNYVIAGGDFNQVFSTVDKSLYPHQDGKWAPGELDVSKIKGDIQFLVDDKTPSCRSLDQPYVDADKEKFQYYIIDGYMVSGNVSVNSIKTQDLGFVSSDHNPVVLNITLK